MAPFRHRALRSGLVAGLRRSRVAAREGLWRIASRVGRTALGERLVGSRFADRVRRRPVVLLRLAALALCLMAITVAAVVAVSPGWPGDEASYETVVPEASGGGPTERRSFLSRLIPPASEPESDPKPGPEFPPAVAARARRLPLERRVAQLFLVGFKGQDATSPVFRRLERLGLGGVVVEAANYVGPEQLESLTGQLKATARQARREAPLVMTAQEGGQFSELFDLPPRKAPAEITDGREAAAGATSAAKALRRRGVNGVLAPVLDVGLGEGDALGKRAFSDEPAKVADYARATVSAYRRRGVLAAPKHFPGLGSATGPPDEGAANVGLSLEELRARDLVPFRAAVSARTPAVMVGHGSYVTDDFATPASLSRAIIGDLLRRELRFRGVAITDDLASPAVSLTTSAPDAAIEAIKAGADMVYISGPRSEQESAHIAVLNAVRKREIPRERILEAVQRVLNAKRQYGLSR